VSFQTQNAHACEHGRKFLPASAARLSCDIMAFISYLDSCFEVVE